MEENSKKMVKKRWCLKSRVAPILNIFCSMWSPRGVDNFPPKDHYLNFTLTHSNLNSKCKTLFGSKHVVREKEETKAKEKLKRAHMNNMIPYLELANCTTKNNRVHNLSKLDTTESAILEIWLADLQFLNFYPLICYFCNYFPLIWNL